MTKMFALLALVLIASGVIVLAVPKPASRRRALDWSEWTAPIDRRSGARDRRKGQRSALDRVWSRQLYYSRRNYVLNREALARRQGRLKATCDFETITEKEKDRSYEAKMTCIEGAQEWTETNTFDLDPSGSAITVWIEGEKHQT